MKTYALVGESGTGKSYNSINVAARYKLDYIIDDGILINKNKIMAGTSAKKAPTVVAAIKRAIFDDKEHRTEVVSAIERLSPKGILILATSEKMAQKIRHCLLLVRRARNVTQLFEYVKIMCHVFFLLIAIWSQRYD